MQHAGIETDVAIIGGGPGGSTLASLILKYAPHRRVLVLEKEKFPRDHVGESQLPAVAGIIHEMGCWDQIEDAGFPLKVGATYRWGTTEELWDFDFIDPREVERIDRPGRYEGPRRFTAFQADRARYDDILLRHAEALGAAVMEESQVVKIHRDGDRVESLELRDGRIVTASYYIDASGHIGVLRRGMGVKTKAESSLRNIAMWDYWENADWAAEIGVGGTRVQVMSQSGGWMWFIPLGPTRASIGFVCPVDHYKTSGLSADALYRQAIANDAHISSLIEHATPRGTTKTTTDWSFTSERLYGDNWFLVGEAAGFADPILAAGLTITHAGARELAYILNDLFDEPRDAEWLKASYADTQLRRIRQHIRFADFWYAAKGRFEDLKEHCVRIAGASGVRMTPEAAWRWLAQGGFAHDGPGPPTTKTDAPPSLKQVLGKLTATKREWALETLNVLTLNLDDVDREVLPVFVEGKVVREAHWVRGQDRLILTGHYGMLSEVLAEESDLSKIVERIKRYCADGGGGRQPSLRQVMESLEAMINERWVVGSYDTNKPCLALGRLEHDDQVHWNEAGASTHTV